MPPLRSILAAKGSRNHATISGASRGNLPLIRRARIMGYSATSRGLKRIVKSQNIGFQAGMIRR